MNGNIYENNSKAIQFNIIFYKFPLFLYISQKNNNNFMI